MSEIPNSKRFDLEERTYKFSKNVAIFCKELPKTTPNVEYIKQVIRSSGSTGANYIEANESLGKKDFLMKIKICLKEAKESAYWLRLIMETNLEESRGIQSLLNEALELKKIFSSILDKSR